MLPEKGTMLKTKLAGPAEFLVKAPEPFIRIFDWGAFFSFSRGPIISLNSLIFINFGFQKAIKHRIKIICDAGESFLILK